MYLVRNAVGNSYYFNQILNTLGNALETPTDLRILIVQKLDKALPQTPSSRYQLNVIEDP